MQVIVSFLVSLVFMLNDAFMGIYCITNKQTENQVSEGGFVWTNNKSMTWTTNYNESNLSPLKGKHNKIRQQPDVVG